MSVAAIVPAYNEVDRIVATVQGLLKLPEIGEICVIDDGSTDQTASLAEEAGAKVLRFPVNQGKAAAVWAGIQQTNAEILLLCDADLGDSVAGVLPLLEPLVKGEADMTIGVLPNTGDKQGFGIVKRVARYGIHHCTMQDCIAPLSGQRACRREIFSHVRSLARGYGMEVGLTIDALRYGYCIMEVPICVSHRSYGRTWHGFTHRGKQLVDVLEALHHRYLEV